MAGRNPDRRGAAGRESRLVRDCLDLLRVRGVFSFRVNTTGIYDPKRRLFRSFHGLRGVSDILGVLPDGRFLAVECKVGRNRLTDEQAWFLAVVQKHGGAAVMVKSVGELDDFLDAVLGSGRLEGDLDADKPVG